MCAVGRGAPCVLLPWLLVALAGCDGGAPGGEAGSPGQPAESPPLRIVDSEGRAVTLESAPERIVSLVPAATQVLLALGAGPRLVGRTEHDTLSALASLPSVGGGLHPGLETLVALEPNLVIRFAGGTDRVTPDRLARAGIVHLAVAPESIDDVRAMIHQLGRVVGRPEAADSLVHAIDSTLADIRDRVEGRDPVRVAWVMSGGPPWAAGPGTYIDELITLAGGVNVFADLERRWAAVSPESLVGRRPDVIVTPRGTTLDPRITGDIPVRQVSALVQLPGPDLPTAAREMARALHPSLFR